MPPCARQRAREQGARGTRQIGEGEVHANARPSSEHEGFYGPRSATLEEGGRMVQSNRIPGCDPTPRCRGVADSVLGTRRKITGTFVPSFGHLTLPLLTVRGRLLFIRYINCR